MAADGSLAWMPTGGLRRAGARRILMTADTLGGVWPYALELCRGLSARGHEVALATMGALPDAAQRREAIAIDGLELYASAYRLIWMDDPWRDVAAAGDWLLGLAANLRPDLVHLNDLGHGALAWPAPVLTVLHSCVLSWWEAVHGVPAPARWNRYAERVRQGLIASDLVVAPTQAMLAQARQHYGPLGRARVIANGRSTPQPGAGSRVRMVFAAGRLWDEGKNLAALAAVAPQLAWPVCIAGPDRSPDGTRIELPDVDLLGALDSADVRRCQARASIYALPARYEPFGLGVLEAAQAGCALVLGDIASLRENWDDAALFVAPDDRAALLAALQRLIGDEALRTRLAATALARARRFTPAAMVAAYSAAYSALGTSRPNMGEVR